MTLSSYTPANTALARIQAFHPESAHDIKIVQGGLLNEIEIGIVLGALDAALDNIPLSSPVTDMVKGLIVKLEAMSPE